MRMRGRDGDIDWKRIFKGAAAGLIGALPAAMVLWGAWLLPVLGILLLKVALWRGFAVVLLVGTLGGLVYTMAARLFGTRQRDAHVNAYVVEKSWRTTVLIGLFYGCVMWLLVVLLLVPWLLGFGHELNNAGEHPVSLLAFLFYGVTTALVYDVMIANRARRSRSKTKLGLAVSIILCSVVLTPMMLLIANRNEWAELNHNDRIEVKTDGERKANTARVTTALKLPSGYRAEVVASGFTFPTSVAFQASNRNEVFVAESGYSYGPKTAEARIMRVDSNGNAREFLSGFQAPINGLLVRGDNMYVSHRGKITEISLDTKQRRDLVSGLPSLGDHQNNDLVFGGDGALYFGQGSATNAGVVGDDNFVYGWADRYPQVHDLPSRDLKLTDIRYQPLDLSTLNPIDRRETGAFLPFGKVRKGEHSLSGQSPANGAIHRLDIQTGQLQVFADGLRNPYGLAVSPAGELYASHLGYDDRGIRAVSESPDWIVKIKRGAWYGWPDYAGTMPLTDSRFASKRGVNRLPLIANPPPVEPPLTELPPHFSPMKLAVAPEAFGTRGLFVGVFGDGQPLTGQHPSQTSTGVLVIHPEDGGYRWFARNRDDSRAGRLDNGFRRVIDVKFAGNAMYVLDFGLLEFTDMAPNPIPKTGVLWKVERVRR